MNPPGKVVLGQTVVLHRSAPTWRCSDDSYKTAADCRSYVFNKQTYHQEKREML